MDGTFSLFDKKSQRRREKNALVQPFLKWVGGKRQLLHVIRKYVPAKFERYYEPFVGGGAVCFDLNYGKSTISDVNSELINCYQVIRDNPKELIEHANRHDNTSEHFYEVRSMDRQEGFEILCPVVRAARIIYLNKTCYNGLFRVNSQGQFNSPFGAYRSPNYVNESVIYAVSQFLNQSEINIMCAEYDIALSDAGRNDFIYLDPPYDPVSDTASFTGYNFIKFDKDEQIRLKEHCDVLTRRKCKILLSNSDTSFIRKLYDHHSYTIIPVEATRNINSVATLRGKVGELLIANYKI